MKKIENEHTNKEKVEKHFQANKMNSLKDETVNRFKELYRDFPELIDYRIKSGNVYQKAQAMLIKSVAIGDLQASDSLAAPDTCEALLDNTSKITQK